MSINNNVTVIVTTDAPPVTGANFGVPLVIAAPLTLPAGFTERVRFYESNADAQADADLSAAMKTALAVGFSQSPRVSKMGVGRNDYAIQSEQFTIGGGVVDGDQFDITIAGILTSYVATTPPDDEGLVAAALRGLLTTNLGAAYTVSGAAAVVIVTENEPNGFTFSSLYTPNGGASSITELAISAGPSFSSEMDALLLEQSGWYAFNLEERSAIAIEAGDTWVAANDRLQIAQSSDADVKTAVATDIGSILQLKTADRTNVMWLTNNAEWSGFAWLAKKLAANPDVTTTAWAYATLAGVTIDPTLTGTERSNMDGKNVSYYTDFYGQGSAWRGKLASGRFLDVRITLDWVSARIAEAIAQLFLSISNANSKIPYSDRGIQQMTSEVLAVLKRGEQAGHFNFETSSVSSPIAALVPAVDKANRIIRISFLTQLAGAIDNADVIGSVVLELPA